MALTENPSVDIRQQLLDAIAHFEHVLPGQAPIKDFVHHNTLHGYQHLNFADALKASHELTGAYGYEPAERYREYFKKARITLEDLSTILDEAESLKPDESICEKFKQKDVYLAALLNPLKSITGCQFTWHIEELNELNQFQQSVSQTSREKLLSAAKHHGEESESEAINALWFACLKSLNLEHYLLHPEELMDLDPEAAESMLRDVTPDESSESSDVSMLHRQVVKESKNLLGQLIRKVGDDITLRGFLNTITGKDILDDIRPVLQQHLANYLDQGMSAWHPSERNQGFYMVWRSSALDDLAWVFDEMPEWQDSINSLPDDAMDTILLMLKQLGIPETHWAHYLQRLALEIPGWSGLFLWRHLHPDYEGDKQPVEMLDYLAVRLVLERLFAQRLCREQWQIEANLDVLRWYFRRRHSEFFVRYVMFNNHLPEYLFTLAQRQIERSLLDHEHYYPWKQLADMIMAWRNSPMSDQPKGYSVFHHAWPLFHLTQHLGLCADDVESLNAEQIKQMFGCLSALNNETSGFIWLQAYERNYRDALFNAVVANENRGRWKHSESKSELSTPDASTQNLTRPEAQVTFCMDDREESFRRHLEEHNPAIETLGAAGFFGVPINWKGLDDTETTPLCPVVVDPVHTLCEVPNDNQQPKFHKHKHRRNLRFSLKNLIQQETRRSLLAPLLITLIAPFSFLSLLGKTFSFRRMNGLGEKLRNHFDIPVQTHVELNTSEPKPDATPSDNQFGYTDEEQADKVQGFLRTVGLNKPLAPLVVMMGHGSYSVNNPHLAAYDCGACSGRHGGPNARIFAAIANRPEIRIILGERGVNIPEDTWFMGAEHNTADENISWYDQDQIPENTKSAFQKLRAEIDFVTQKSAHERCRRLASAPKKPSLKKALNHIIGRSYDISQARPELGHATNAAAFIGRRSISQGAFFDRRVFLISYDPTQDDEEGHVIEAILLAAGPVGAGINLEYYFSTVNNEQYGSGSKVTHNVSGLFAVMDGTSSDLRTGLPKQMIEIHEAMRLQVLVEAKIEVLGKIYQRQPALQELVGKGWLLLSAKDPDSEQIHVFKPDKGFVPWDGQQSDIPLVDNSTDWYDGKHLPLSPALIKQPPNTSPADYSNNDLKGEFNNA